MILTAIVFAVVGAGALVLFVAIVRDAIDEARGVSVSQRVPEAAAADRAGRFTRERDRDPAPQAVAR
ncbi:MAG TPA: hypothetical protein VFW33_00925 [Gemmataceae bacterium]|nr:hypothetical protein [Gemmataceae bacterium]